MPDDDWNFAALCDHLGLSPKTARKLVHRSGVAPRRDGTALKFTSEQVQIITAHRPEGGTRSRGRETR